MSRTRAVQPCIESTQLLSPLTASMHCAHTAVRPVKHTTAQSEAHDHMTAALKRFSVSMGTAQPRGYIPGAMTPVSGGSPLSTYVLPGYRTLSTAASLPVYGLYNNTWRRPPPLLQLSRVITSPSRFTRWPFSLASAKSPSLQVCMSPRRRLRRCRSLQRSRMPPAGGRLRATGERRLLKF